MYKVRFCFEKTGTAAYISHLDLMKSLQRSFVRAGLPVRYSQGFNPHIEMSIVVPLSTGYESVCDLCDLEMNCDALPTDFVQRVNGVLPLGMHVRWAGEAVRPVNQIAFCEYEIALPKGDCAAMQQLFTQPVVLEKRSKRGSREVNVCEYIRSITFTDVPGGVLCRCVLSAGNDPLNPMYVTRGLQNAGLVEKDAGARYRRTQILDQNCQIFCG